MNTKTGALFGIGVGPGDPELITLKSVRILNNVDVVFAAASTKNSYSLAVSVAKPHIPEATSVKKLAFPMSKDKKVTEQAWQENTRVILKELEQGKDVAFITLGDPMTYSTFGYILRHIQAMAPHVDVKTIPGITSYLASAACLNTPLVEGDEALLILSGVKGGERLRQVSGHPENVVFLKAYRNIKDIIAAIKEADMLDNSAGLINCGLPDEEIVKDIQELEDRSPDYWTLLIAKQTKNHGTET
jgi:precorrin-2/cobalt-factor-2 C20-methyltransferase